MRTNQHQTKFHDKIYKMAINRQIQLFRIEIKLHQIRITRNLLFLNVLIPLFKGFKGCPCKRILYFVLQNTVLAKLLLLSFRLLIRLCTCNKDGIYCTLRQFRQQQKCIGGSPTHTNSGNRQQQGDGVSPIP